MCGSILQYITATEPHTDTGSSVCISGHLKRDISTFPHFVSFIDSWQSQNDVSLNTPIFPDSKFSIDTCSDPGPGSNMASESISICINVVSLQCREKIYEHVLHIISLCISTLALLYERRKQESSPCTYITWLHVAAMMSWRVEPGLGVRSSQSILLSSLHGKHQQPICPWSRQHWDQHLISFTAQILLSALHQSMNTATSYFCVLLSHILVKVYNGQYVSWWLSSMLWQLKTSFYCVFSPHLYNDKLVEAWSASVSPSLVIWAWPGSVHLKPISHTRVPRAFQNWYCLHNK